MHDSFPECQVNPLHAKTELLTHPGNKALPLENNPNLSSPVPLPSPNGHSVYPFLHFFRSQIPTRPQA